MRRRGRFFHGICYTFRMDNAVTTEEVLADLAAAPRAEYSAVLLDFDHTLFLDNSTDRFLDALRPRLLAFLLVAASDWLCSALAWCGLWRYNDQRDFMRVLLCTVLMPWNHFIWPGAARRLAQKHMNTPLLAALPPDCPVIVVSFGFRHVIRPLLHAAGLNGATLVCSDVTRLRNLRVTGKPHALTAAAPNVPLDRALFVTDSHEDDDVAALVARAHLVRWAPCTPPAFHGYYVPMRYTVEGKYPNSRYFTYQILLEDVALLLLAYAFAPTHVVALACLFVSLYAIYELGYYANDHVAVKLETTPKVSDAARAYPPLPRFKPWAWALCCAVPGIAVAGPAYWLPSATPGYWPARDLMLWTAALVTLYGVFFLFNRLRPRKRMAVFPILHLFKTFAFVLFVPLTLVGGLLLTAQIVSISLHYGVYRFGGNADRFNRQGWRLLVFFALIAAAAAVAPAHILTAAPLRFALIVLWNIVRGIEQAQRKNIVRIVGEHIRRLSAG